MTVDTVALLIAFAGLVLYTVLAGADFGAGVWQLLAGRGDGARRIRDHAHRAMAPVWEANHVWLILDLTVLWTAFPVVFGSICSTLAMPLLIAAIGIVMRGVGYTLQSAIDAPRDRRRIDLAFAVSSLLTPFVLGAIVGAVASGRVPVGNAVGNPVTSWINPTSITCGALAVASGAFLAAVYLAADARRFDDAYDLERAFRSRAIGAGMVSGTLALAALAVIHHDARRLFDGLTHGAGLAAVVASALCGLAALTAVGLGRFGVARVLAAGAVAALLLGWAAAQRPYVLPNLRLADAAADRATVIAVLVSCAVGALILFPSLALLFRLALGGRLDAKPGAEVAPVTGPDARRPRWAGRAAAAAFVVGIGLLTFADAGSAHAAGVAALGFAALAGYTAIAPDQLAAQHPRVHVEPPPQGPRW